MAVIISSLQSTWKILWRTILFFLTWGLLLAIFFVPFGSELTKWYQAYPIEARLYGDITSAITIMAATWVMTRFIDRRPFLTIGLAFNYVFRDFLIGAAIGCTWLGASVGIIWAFGWASPISPSGFSRSVLTGSAIAMFFNVLAQELLLCGFIFQTIRSRSNVIIAMLVSAALFAGYHAGAFKGEWLPAINVFTAGLLFCLAYILTGNLWFPIAIHFLWDVLLGPVLGLTESGKNDLGGGWKMFTLHGPPLFTGGGFGLEGGLVVTLTTVIILIIICFFQRHKILKLLRGC
ncbi:MAG: type II CAAX endopeptidase family protein [Ignavibacteriaceae bacterium]|jgi:hypothetical protein